MRPWIRAVFVAGISACHGRHPPPGASTTDDDGGYLVPPPPQRPPATVCVQSSRDWIVTPNASDAGSRDEGSVVAIALGDSNSPAWVAWTGALAEHVNLARFGGATATLPLGDGELAGPLVTVTGTVPAVAWIFQRAGVRTHVVVTGADLRRRCEQPEELDDGMSLTIAGVHAGGGVLVAWDEDRTVEPAAPGVVAGTILEQVVPVGGADGRCNTPRVLSPSGQDAGDPLAVALPDGGAAVFWLASERFVSSDGQDSATNLWGVAVDAAGAPRGAPFALTARPARRFGLSAVVSGTTLWLAYRVAAESDNEGRGDGGDVVVVAVDARITHAQEPVVVTPDVANPTGSPAIVADAHGAEVWWLDRRQDSIMATRRALTPDGQVASAPEDEPSMGGELPVQRAGNDVTVAEHKGGGVGIARYRCPWLPEDRSAGGVRP